MATNDRTASKLSGIYQIRNTVNGKVYIGSAANFRERWTEHRKRLKARNHHSRSLQAAWIKHDAINFVFEVLELVPLCDLLHVEQQYLDRVLPFGRAGYNICRKAGSSLGVKWSAETRAKLCAIRKAQMSSPEMRARLSAANKGFKHTPEAQAKIAESGKGRKRTRESIERSAAAIRGTKRSAETRAKLSKARRRRPPASPETRAMLSAALKGRATSPETRVRLARAGMGHTVSPETRAKISATKKAARLIHE
jgi:group I intron endonuclease